MPRKKTTRNERIKTASRRRRDEDRAQVRQAILEAAGALFMERGYEGFSLREVAEKIGYSPGTIYLYFDNKDDILFAIADEGFQRFAKVLHVAVKQSENAAEQLHLLGQAYIAFAQVHPTHYRLMFIERTDFTVRKSEQGGETWDDSFAILEEVVERAIQAGVVREGDPSVISDALWAVLHGVVALGITMPNFDKDRVQKTIDVAFEMIERGIFHHS